MADDRLNQESTAFTRSAAWYDAVYGRRHNYQTAVDQLVAWIDAGKTSAGNRLLDVGCGTGTYLSLLARRFEITGIDLSEPMLAVARNKHPGGQFLSADLVDFALHERFDVVLCLGSSIGYALTVPRLQQALRSMANHLNDGGVIVVEPWFSPDAWEDGRLSADLTDEPDLKIARVLVSGSAANGTVSTLDIHHLVATPGGVEQFCERHEMGLFTDEAYRWAFAGAGLTVSRDPVGLLGRGMYFGTTG